MYNVVTSISLSLSLSLALFSISISHADARLPPVSRSRAKIGESRDPRQWVSKSLNNTQWLSSCSRDERCFQPLLWSTFEQTLRCRPYNAKQLGKPTWPGCFPRLSSCCCSRLSRIPGFQRRAFFSPAGTLINHRPRDRPLRRDYADTRANFDRFARNTREDIDEIYLRRSDRHLRIEDEVCFLNRHAIRSQIATE